MGRELKSFRCAAWVAALLGLMVSIVAPIAAAQTSAKGTRRKSASGSAVTSAAPVLALTPGIGSTVAGTGVGGYSGDGGPADVAQFNFPSGLARDAQGNFYVADAINSVVRKFSVGGAISTVAGNGTQGYSGDGSAATLAQLAFPTGVAVDGSGNIFIADFFNACVRKVDTNGVITTFATAGGFLIRGVATDSAGNVYFSSWFEGVYKADSVGSVTRIAGDGTSGFGGDGGPALSAQTANVAGLDVDSQGNVYFAEVANSDIREVDTNGIITTVAGNQQFGYSGDGAAATSAKLNGPTDVRVDAARNLYIADSSNNLVRKVNVAGTISTIAGNGNFGYAGDGGLATAMQFAGLTAVVLDGNSNLFVADTGNSVIRRVKVDTTALDFGTVTVGQSSVQKQVTVSNTGAAALHISSIVASANFAVQSTCSTSAPITPGADCFLNISFVPIAIGVVTGTVTVSDDSAGSPHVVTVSGQGTIAANPDFAISLSAPSLSVGKESSVHLTATITPSQGFTGNIALACSGLPSHATCSFAPSPVHADGSNTPLASTVTISTGVTNVAGLQHGDGQTYLAAVTGVFSTGLLGFIFLPGARRRVQSKRSRIIQTVLLMTLLCAGLVGCGTLGGKTSTTPPGSYTVTVSASSGNVSHSATFNLTVQ
jgi:hypothetical protein